MFNFSLVWTVTDQQHDCPRSERIGMLQVALSDFPINNELVIIGVVMLGFVKCRLK